MVGNRSLSGFTLVEVLVALALGGFVVLAAHQTYGAAGDAARHLVVQRDAHETEMRVRAQLVATFGSVDVAGRAAVGFRGAPATVAFSTLADSLVELSVAGGWLLCRTASNGSLSTDSLLTAESVWFDYLLRAGANEAWVAEWWSPVSAPLAVRIRLTRPGVRVDTLLLAIGGRG